MQVLKALSLIRLGRQDESMVVLQEVHTEHPADDATLQAMTICYWELHKRKFMSLASQITSGPPRMGALKSHQPLARAG